MDHIPRHRGFRFSLRTLFVVVTLVAVWLEWELRFIRERRTTRQALDAVCAPTLFQHPRQSIPFWRRWLGDEAVDSLCILHGDEETAKKVRRLFPEIPEAEMEGYVTHLEPSRSLLDEIEPSR